MVDLTHGGLDSLGDLGHDPAGREMVERLLKDSEALAHLLHPHQVPIVGVAVLSGGDIEQETVIDRVGMGAAYVVVDARGPQAGPGDAEIDGIL